MRTSERTAITSLYETGTSPPSLPMPRYAQALVEVIGEAPVGVLDEDLERACLGALECSREDCREFALGMTWEASARIFLRHVAPAAKSGRKKAA